MAINADKPERWADDIRASVDLYNTWYTTYAPEAYRQVRGEARDRVLRAIDLTDNMRRLTPEVLEACPDLLPVLRMATSPPLAVDRLVGLSGVPKTLVAAMEEGSLPSRMNRQALHAGLQSLAEVLIRMVDRDLFLWLDDDRDPPEVDRIRAASIVADRLTLSIANPVIRNAQEKRQLDIIADWLRRRGYQERRHRPGRPLEAMQPGTYAFRMPVAGGVAGEVTIPIDVVIQPYRPRPSGLPIFIEAKSAGDFTNVNKRRKEEASKMRQLRGRYGDDVEYILFLGGYFDRGYLEYESREGIDWVWEHRPDDLALLGLDREDD